MNETNERKKILVVDDHPHSRDLVTRLLKHEGFDADAVEGGHEAMHWLAEGDFAAVVTDMDMPEMNGIELLRRIRQRLPQMPVVLMTPFYTDEVKEGGLAWGAVAVLQKPFTGKQLGGILRTAFQRRVEREAVAA